MADSGVDSPSPQIGQSPVLSYGYIDFHRSCLLRSVPSAPWEAESRIEIN
jgi:hypothetical protein